MFLRTFRYNHPPKFSFFNFFFFQIQGRVFLVEAWHEVRQSFEHPRYVTDCVELRWDDVLLAVFIRNSKYASFCAIGIRTWQLELDFRLDQVQLTSLGSWCHAFTSLHFPPQVCYIIALALICVDLGLESTLMYQNSVSLIWPKRKLGCSRRPHMHW